MPELNTIQPIPSLLHSHNTRQNNTPLSVVNTDKSVLLSTPPLRRTQSEPIINGFNSSPSISSQEFNDEISNSNSKIEDDSNLNKKTSAKSSTDKKNQQPKNLDAETPTNHSERVTLSEKSKAGIHITGCTVGGLVLGLATGGIGALMATCYLNALFVAMYGKNSYVSGVEPEQPKNAESLKASEPKKIPKTSDPFGLGLGFYRNNFGDHNVSGDGNMITKGDGNTLIKGDGNNIFNIHFHTHSTASNSPDAEFILFDSPEGGLGKNKSEIKVEKIETLSKSDAISLIQTLSKHSSDTEKLSSMMDAKNLYQVTYDTGEIALLSSEQYISYLLKKLNNRHLAKASDNQIESKPESHHYHKTEHHHHHYKTIIERETNLRTRSIQDIEEDSAMFKKRPKLISAETQTEDIKPKKSTSETVTQTDDIKTFEVLTQTEEIKPKKRTPEIITQTDDIKQFELLTQTEEIKPKKRTPEIITQTDDIKQFEVLTQTENIKPIVDDVKKYTKVWRYISFPKSSSNQNQELVSIYGLGKNKTFKTNQPEHTKKLSRHDVEAIIPRGKYGETRLPIIWNDALELWERKEKFSQFEYDLANKISLNNSWEYKANESNSKCLDIRRQGINGNDLSNGITYTGIDLAGRIVPYKYDSLHNKHYVYNKSVDDPSISRDGFLYEVEWRLNDWHIITNEPVKESLIFSEPVINKHEMPPFRSVPVSNPADHKNYFNDIKKTALAKKNELSKGFSGTRPETTFWRQGYTSNKYNPLNLKRV
ncbi:hypothetical protein [Vibrio cholerae]|uniref:hypothetical protein n=1 Tax=Vibrio cholerae TaxID=666 RepID=UPI002DA1E981|nr:hypothetical protein [Vibrio cholerae]MEB5517846.1 hypothetical protein [Vibrio cholerae]